MTRAAHLHAGHPDDDGNLRVLCWCGASSAWHSPDAVRRGDGAECNPECRRDGVMLTAAKERALVRLPDGRSARLFRWRPARGRPGRRPSRGRKAVVRLVGTDAFLSVPQAGLIVIDTPPPPRQEGPADGSNPQHQA